jgi:DNA-binding PadR family transcriptional regulator
MEKAGLIESKLQHSEGRGPARKVYNITEQGKMKHLEGATNALREPRQASVPFLLGLSNLPAIPHNQILISLNKNVNQLDKRLEHLSQRVDEQSPLPPYVEAMFEYSRMMVEAELSWMKAFIRKVEAGNV